VGNDFARSPKIQPDAISTFFVWFYESNGHYIINGINSEFIFANGFTELAHSHPNISVCTLYIRVQTYVSDRLEVMFLY